MNALAVLSLALKIADHAARSDIECMCEWAGASPSGPHWYDTTNVNPDDREFVKDAVIYLRGRGLLDQHPTNPLWVRPRSIEDAVDAQG